MHDWGLNTFLKDCKRYTGFITMISFTVSQRRVHGRRSVLLVSDCLAHSGKGGQPSDGLGSPEVADQSIHYNAKTNLKTLHKASLKILKVTTYWPVVI